MTPWMLLIPEGLSLTDRERDDLGGIAALLPKRGGEAGLLILPADLVAGNNVSRLDSMWRAALLGRRDDLGAILQCHSDVDAVWYAAGDLSRAALRERLDRLERQTGRP